MIYIQLFLSFLQIGLFSVGGGYAAIPLVQSLIVERQGWITMTEFTNLITIAEMTPGPIAVNSATFVGIRIAGLPGAVAATWGCIFPSCIIVSVLAYIYRRYRGGSAMGSILGSLRPAVVALIAGFLQCDTNHLIRGVLLNRMSKGYYEIIKPLIEQELSLKVVGYFPDQRGMHLESRHLGLVLPDELADIRKQLRETADCLAETIDLDALTEIAAHAEELDGEETAIAQHPICCTIAVARDDAFCFYYEDNLRLLKQYGAELTYFSPLHDEKLPDCDGVLFGGGYPELYAKELSANTSMRDAIRTAFRRGMPMVAECGGFMYLHSLLYPKMEAGSVAEGCAMAGVLDAECRYAGKLVRFGYIELEEVRGNFLPPYEKIKAHEFHYFDSSENGRACIATKPATGKK